MRWIVFLLLVILASCASPQPGSQPAVQCKWPEIPNNGGCCRDLNENGICDTVDFATEIETQKQQEYEEAAQKARETAERAGKYKPTITNLLYENASKIRNYRFLYKGDEIVVANGTITRKLIANYPIGDQDINGRRMKVVINTVHIDLIGRNATAECIPPPELVKKRMGTPCDNFVGFRFPVDFDKFVLKMPTKWLEDFLYRTPTTILPGSHIGDRTATLYKFTDLQDPGKTTNIWIDDLAAIPLRVEVWQNGKLNEKEDYIDFYVI
ncbi:MAG: hypothetical protein QXR48_01225 [Candidatus Woesearchaeota archaeon]